MTNYTATTAEKLLRTNGVVYEAAEPESCTIRNLHPKLRSGNFVLQINEFHYDSEADLAFNNWFVKCKELCLEKACLTCFIYMHL